MFVLSLRHHVQDFDSWKTVSPRARTLSPAATTWNNRRPVRRSLARASKNTRRCGSASTSRPRRI